MRVATTLTIPEEHPAFSGHFPEMPILPGVLLLDETLRVLELETGVGPGQWHVAAAKFLKPVRPGEQLQIEHEPLANGSVRFNVVSAGALVASGTLLRAASKGGSGGD